MCKAFRAKGHEAYSCDIQEPSGGHPEWHILGDALKAVKGGQVVTMDGVTHDIGKWELLIAHPPCTYLSNAGARFLYPKGVLNEQRLRKGLMAKDFFLRFLWADIPKIAVENPIPSLDKESTMDNNYLVRTLQYQIITPNNITKTENGKSFYSNKRW